MSAQVLAEILSVEPPDNAEGTTGVSIRFALPDLAKVDAICSRFRISRREYFTIAHHLCSERLFAEIDDKNCHLIDALAESNLEAFRQIQE